MQYSLFLVLNDYAVSSRLAT